jgi:hypothetical protein
MNPLLAIGMLSMLGAVPNAPTIQSLEPENLALTSTIQVAGTGFVEGQTTVTVGGKNQNVAYVDEVKVVFVVSLATELGTQPLVITTPHGQVEQDVEVVPAPPKLGQVTPDPIVLGTLVNVQGSNLLTVEEVTMNDIACEVTAQTDQVIVFVAPLDSSLIGTTTLKVQGEFGYDVEQVMAGAPTPQIDQLAPNPIRAGDLLTIKGTILNWNVSAEVAGLQAPVVEVSEGQIIVQVPAQAQVGPRMVNVSVGATASEPAGPVHVTAPDTKRPSVTTVYPATVHPGGRVWLTGENLEDVDTIAHDLVLEICDKRQCAITTEGLPLGTSIVSISSPAGTDVFSLTVEEPDTVVAPAITELTPNPAFRGEELVIKGSDLFEVNAVIISGQPQSISFVDAEEIRVNVHEETPMGGETLFVSGASGSNALPVVVLAPFASPDTGSSADGENGDALGGDNSPPNGDVGSNPHDGNTADSGCSLGAQKDSTPWPLLVLLSVSYAFFRTRRNSRLPLGPEIGDSTDPIS